MGFDDPICGSGCTTTTCAIAAVVTANVSALASRANRALGDDVAVMGIFLSGPSKDAARNSREVRMRSRFFLVGFLCALAVIACIPNAIAQTVTGSISGEVTDPTGAVVSGAKVVAHNIDTGVDTGTTTNASGVYTIQFLPIGHYEVTVQANGFGTATVPAFALEVLQTATFNVKLQVGSAATTVSVSSA